MKSFIEPVGTTGVQAAKKVMKSMYFKVLRMSFAQSMPSFLKSEKLALHTLGSEQTCLLLSLFLVVHTHALEDGRNRDPFIHFFYE